MQQTIGGRSILADGSNKNQWVIGFVVYRGARHRLISTDRRFVERDEYCYWSICITYLEAAPVSGKPVQSVNKRAQIDYREVLNEPDFTVYAKLREVRKDIARTENIPVYGIASNAQMAEMVTARVTSLEKMADINGIGEAKLEKYGKRFLTVLNAEFTLSPEQLKETGEENKYNSG